MGTFTMSRRIEASPERVFEAFTDFLRGRVHATSIKRVELLTSGPIGKGTRFKETRMMFGREATETMEVTEFEPPRRVGIGAGSCGARFDSVFAIRPDAGGSVVEMTFVCTPVSFFAKLLSPLSRLMTGPM